jgi:hypothetical protein
LIQINLTQCFALMNEWMNERLTLVTSKSIFVGGTLHSEKTDPIWRKTRIAENAKNLFEFILNFFLQVTLVEAVIGKWSDILNRLYLLLIWLHYINLGVMKVVFSLIRNLTLIKLRLNNKLKTKQVVTLSKKRLLKLLQKHSTWQKSRCKIIFKILVIILKTLSKVAWILLK